MKKKVKKVKKQSIFSRTFQKGISRKNEGYNKTQEMNRRKRQLEKGII